MNSRNVYGLRNCLPDTSTQYWDAIDNLYATGKAHTVDGKLTYIPNARKSELQQWIEWIIFLFSGPMYEDNIIYGCLAMAMMIAIFFISLFAVVGGIVLIL